MNRSHVWILYVTKHEGDNYVIYTTLSLRTQQPKKNKAINKLTLSNGM